MTKEKLYEAIGDIKEEHILEAKRPKEIKPYAWVKRGALVACLSLVVGIGSFVGFLLNPPSNGGCGLSSGSELLAAHRENFTPEIAPTILAQFEEPDDVIKVYWTLTNHWFLSDELEDFSQVVTNEVYYIYPGDDEGKDKDIAYSCYDIDENGKLDWGYSTYPSKDAPIPQGLWKLSYEIIDTALADIDYEDYIITKTPQFGTVFVWVRCTTGDLLLTYPSRPDLTGLEIGGIYTLEEVQEILTETLSE